MWEEERESHGVTTPPLPLLLPLSPSSAGLWLPGRMENATLHRSFSLLPSLPSHPAVLQLCAALWEQEGAIYKTQKEKHTVFAGKSEEGIWSLIASVCQRTAGES